ncbi:translesion DNA synthesis-associated protein ImuA [Sapientia aquatica]|nr:translesion DNA synthesis-associated protein ImuA [Sapientia aquatica]
MLPIQQELGGFAAPAIVSAGAAAMASETAAAVNPAAPIFNPAALPELQGVWRANQMAVSRTATCSTGFDIIDDELPSRGWPRSALIELLLQQSGIGEMQLLKPVLSQLSVKQKIVLVQPPYLPQAMACKSWGIATHNLLWIKTASAADALWATEQILKNGCGGAVILWQSNVRNESLRRLHLAAQSTDTWLWLMRPLTARMDSSPAQLRIALRPAAGGISLKIVKRRGPLSGQRLFIPLVTMPVSRHPLEQQNAPVVVRTRPVVGTRSDTSILV